MLCLSFCFCFFCTTSCEFCGVNKFMCIGKFERSFRYINNSAWDLPFCRGVVWYISKFFVKSSLAIVWSLVDICDNFHRSFCKTIWRRVVRAWSNVHKFPALCKLCKFSTCVLRRILLQFSKGGHSGTCELYSQVVYGRFRQSLLVHICIDETAHMQT